MTTRSICLGTHVSLGTKDVTLLYTVPSGFRTIVKEARAFAGTNAGTAIQVSVQRPSLQDYVVLLFGPIALSELLVAPCWTVLHAGDQMSVVADVAGVAFWVSGTELLVV